MLYDIFSVAVGEVASVQTGSNQEIVIVMSEQGIQIAIKQK